jgi:hypothetical protein
MVKVSMVIMSHLSDAQTLNGLIGGTADLHRHINFAKYLLLKYEDTNTEINADAEWELFPLK